jgi:hypothetical protein
MVPAGAFHLSGYAWLDLEGPASELVLVGHPGFNRTLASPETLSIPFPAPVDSVDVGSFVWNILPRSTAPVISFLGRILDRNSGLPIEGVRIETATDPGGMVDGVVWTGPDGRFQLPVSNGPHLVRGYAAGIGYSDSPAESIDFGANGFETFDVGDRYLAPAGASGVPDTGRPDVFLQVSPNPSSGPVTIRLSLPRWGDVRVTVHDVRGRLLFERRGQEPAGALQVNWDGTDREGRPVSSGTYFVRVVGSGFKRTQKVVMTGR